MLRSSRLRHIALAATWIALVVLVGVLIARNLHLIGTSQVSATQTPASSATTFTHYMFTAQFPADDVAHPGDILPVVWQPQSDTSQVTSPTSVHCNISLYGPYATQELAGQVETTLAGPAGHPGTPTVTAAKVTLAVTAPPFSFDARTDVAQPQDLRLPAGLAPGYYVYLASAEDALGATGSEGVLQVVPLRT